MQADRGRAAVPVNLGQQLAQQALQRAEHGAQARSPSNETLTQAAGHRDRDGAATMPQLTKRKSVEAEQLIPWAPLWIYQPRAGPGTLSAV